MTRPPPTIPARRAVTLLEVLVTVAVSVLLTLIVIVSIRGVRGQTLAMRDLHNLRLSGQDLLLWSADNDDKFLNLGPEYPGLWTASLGPQFPPLSPQGLTSFYWGQQTSWNSVLASLTHQSHQHWQSAYGPREVDAIGSGTLHADGPPAPAAGTPQYATFFTRFAYSPTLLTHPAAWAGDIRFTTVADIAPFFAVVRTGQVKHPGGKGMLINRLIPDAPSIAHAAYVDGSAERRAIASFTLPASPPTAVDPSAPGTPVLHTKLGYEGRDR